MLVKFLNFNRNFSISYLSKMYFTYLFFSPTTITNKQKQKFNNNHKAAYGINSSGCSRM